MPTDNRRVAAYLPKEIDARLKAFKLEREFTTQDKLRHKESDADSQAIIAILSEFFGVGQEVTHSGNSPSVDLVRREVFEQELVRLRSELLGELDSELLRIERSIEGKLSGLTAKVNSVERVSAELKDELLGELRGGLIKVAEVPGQLELISEVANPQPEISELLKKSESELQPLPGRSLSKRFSLHEQVAINNKNKWKSQPERFIQWSKSKDPEGIAWEYREDTKLYHPILE